MNAIGIVSCIGFFALVVSVQVLLQWLDARSSAWGSMARRYPASSRADAKELSGRLWMNGRCYAGTSTVAVEGAGLRVEMESPVARLFHPPIFIPWDDITVISEADDASGNASDIDPAEPDMLALRVGDSKSIVLTARAAAAATDRLPAGSRYTRRARRPC
jgi:hypothetical protein